MNLEDIPHYETVSKLDQLFKYGDTYGALELNMVHVTQRGHLTGLKEDQWEE